MSFVLENGIEAGGNSQMHDARAAAQCRLRRHHRRSGQSDRAGKDEHVSQLVFMRVKTAAGQPSLHVAQLELEGRRDFRREALARHGNVDDMHHTRVLPSPAQQQAALESAHRHGVFGLHGAAQDFAGFGVDAGRNIHREHRHGRTVEDFDDLGDLAFHRRREPGSEHGIGNPGGMPVQCIGQLCAAAEQFDAQPPGLLFHRTDDREVRECIARDGGIRSQGHHVDVGAAIDQMARHRKAVAAVVALAAEQHDPLTAHAAEELLGAIHGTARGVLHQHDAGNAIAFGRCGIAALHFLRCINRQHGLSRRGSPSIAGRWTGRVRQ